MWHIASHNDNMVYLEGRTEIGRSNVWNGSQELPMVEEISSELENLTPPKKFLLIPQEQVPDLRPTLYFTRIIRLPITANTSYFILYDNLQPQNFKVRQPILQNFKAVCGSLAHNCWFISDQNSKCYTQFINTE